MATLTGQTIKDSYEQLLHVDRDGGGNTTTLVNVKDGDNGTTFCLQLATTKAMIEGSGSKLFFSDEGGEYISGNNTALTLNSGEDINLTCATGDVNIPANIGLTFGHASNQKIEGDGTDLAIDATGNINITSTVNEANSIYLRANAGTSETIKIHSDQGTSVTEGAASVSLISDAGGVELRSTADLANAINLTVDGGTTSSMTLFNDTGTTDGTDAAGSILLSTDAGGIGLAWADDKDLWAEGGRFVVTANEDAADAIKLHADAGSSQTIQIVNDEGTGAAAIALTASAGGITVGLGGGDGDDLIVDTSTLVVSSDNNRVGIGTTTPDYLLEVSAESADADICITSYDDDTGEHPSLKLRKADGTESSPALIGNNEVIGMITFQGYTNAFRTGAEIVARAAATPASGTDIPADLEFWVASDDAVATQKMTLLSNGNLGIGETGPSRKLEIKTSSDQQAVLINHASSTDTEVVGMRIDFSAADPDDKTQWFLYCEDSAAQRFTVYSDGDMLADGQSINSDERLKENIVDATSKLDDINKLKVRSFNFRETDSETGQQIHSKESASRKRIGFIAQEYEEVFPSLVREAEYCTEKEAIEAKDAVVDDEGNIIEEAIDASPGRNQLIRKTLKWDALVPILVKAVQELSAKVEALENA